MLQSCLTKQLIETNVLLFIEPERVFVTRSFRLLCSFLGGIHSFGLKGVRLGRTPGLAERAPLYAEKFFGIQRYSLLASSEAKNPRRKNFRKIYAKPPLRLPRVGRFPLQYYNHAGKKKPSVRTGAVWSGQQNRGISPGCILQHERSVFLFRSLSRYKLY